jgi:hypothetical protein
MLMANWNDWRQGGIRNMGSRQPGVSRPVSLPSGASALSHPGAVPPVHNAAKLRCPSWASSWPKAPRFSTLDYASNGLAVQD